MPQTQSSKFVQIATGVLALILLGIGAFLFFFQPETNPVVTGMMIRIGALLGVIWLAFPQLESLKGRVPTIAIGIGILMLAFVAARPNMGKVIVSIVTISFAVGAVLKWLSKIADGGKTKR